MPHVDMSSNQWLNIPIQNKTEIGQFNPSSHIFHKLKRVRHISPDLALPDIKDILPLYIAYIGNSLLTSDYEKSCLQSVEGLDLIPELTPLTCTNDTRM